MPTTDRDRNDSGAIGNAVESPPIIEGELLIRIREATRSAHAELDASLALVGPELTVDRYRRFLRATASVLTTLEPALDRWFGRIDGPTRCDRLRADLRDLGVETAPPPWVLELPNDLAEALGAAYVVEGSSLGGLVVARHVSEAFGASAPTRYLTLHGRATKEHFRAFCEKLAAFDRDADEAGRARACAYARVVFDAYMRSATASGATEKRTR